LVKKVLKEKELMLSGLIEKPDEKIINAGKSIKADYIIWGIISKFGNKKVLILKIYGRKKLILIRRIIFTNDNKIEKLIEKIW